MHSGIDSARRALVGGLTLAASSLVLPKLAGAGSGAALERPAEPSTAMWDGWLTPEMVREDIVGNWQERVRICQMFYAQLWSKIDGPMAVFSLLLTRKLLKQHTPGVLLAIGEDWWPPEIPDDPRYHYIEWPLERWAKLSKWNFAKYVSPGDSTQWRIAHVLHRVTMAINYYVTDEDPRQGGDGWVWDAV
jgi:hypothetical protein